MNLKELFKWDIDNHNTIIGGWMGIAHGLVTAGVTGIPLAIMYKTGNMQYANQALLAGLVSVGYYFWKENLKDHKLKQFPKWRGLDSFMDWIVPIGVLYYFYTLVN